MNDERLRAAYQAALAIRHSADRIECPSPELIQALVEHRGSQSERLDTVDHVMACRECLAEFELLRSLATERPAPSRHWSIPVALAAAVVLGLGAVLIWRARNPGVPDLERGGSLSLLPIAPQGEIGGTAGPITITWRSATGVARYELTVVRGDGTPLYAVATPDTSVTLPDSITLEPEREYRWQVTGRSVSGSVLQSPVTRFRMRRAPP